MDKDKSNLSQEPQQLELEGLSFQLSQATFEEQTKALQIPMSLVPLASSEKAPKRYFGYSLALHGLLLLSAMTFAVTQKMQTPQVETISFEIVGDSGSTSVSSAPAASQEAPVMAAPAEEEELKEASKAQLVPQAPVQSEVLKPSAAKIQALQKAISVAKSQSVEIPTAAENLDDISVPELDESNTKSLNEAAESAKAQQKEIQSKLAATPLITSDDSDIERAQKEMQDQLSADQEAQDQKALDVEKKTKQDLARLEQERNRRREQEKQMQAALAAHEKRAAEKAEADRQASLAAAVAAREASEAQAKAQAEKEAAAAEKARQENAAATRAKLLAAEKAESERAARAAKEAAEKAALAAAAKGAGSSGEGSATDGGGLPSEGQIRQLEDLRQMPGNPRPQYDIEDRVENRKGDVVFWAYISKSGTTSQFKLVQSSGHRTLDRKTLQALKQWKFYPGQEGWVELPFKWDLEGGVQEKPTLLRRR